MDIGEIELLVVVLGVPALVYWVIRVGVRHGTLDAYRIDREDQRFAELAEERRREAAPGGPGSG
jgi:hypothetical protein